MEQRNIVNRLFDLHQTNFVVRDVKVFEDKIVVEVQANSDRERICSNCRKLTPKVHDQREITLKDIPYGLKECEWHVKFSRVKCECRQGPQNEFLSFKSEKHNITKRLQDNVEFMLCSKMLIVADTARIFALNYNVVYDIDQDVLYRMIQSYEIPDPVSISVDEKSFKKGHSYVTVVTDADRRKVIWVASGNSKSSLDEFFQILGPERCSKIKIVAKDLHIPYKASCDEYIPQALQVADHFHVIQSLNQAIDDCRKELSVGSNLKIGKRKTIHRMNWLLRVKKENLTEERVKSIESLQDINNELYKAYLHKEQFYNFFTFKTHEIRKAELFLTSWIVEAFKVKLKGLTDFAEYIARNTEILLNIIRTRRSSAVSEGINTKIGVIKAMAYGYKKIEYFKLKIMQRCGYLGQGWQQA